MDRDEPSVSFLWSQNGHHFADDFIKFIFLNKPNITYLNEQCILIPISLKLVCDRPILLSVSVGSGKDSVLNRWQDITLLTQV